MVVVVVVAVVMVWWFDESKATLREKAQRPVARQKGTSWGHEAAAEHTHKADSRGLSCQWSDWPAGN
jgi:hypothetical protein